MCLCLGVCIQMYRPSTQIGTLTTNSQDSIVRYINALSHKQHLSMLYLQHAHAHVLGVLQE